MGIEVHHVVGEELHRVMSVGLVVREGVCDDVTTSEVGVSYSVGVSSDSGEISPPLELVRGRGDSIKLAG